MNKSEIRQLLVKEVKASNISELGKSLLIEMLDGEQIYRDTEHKPVTVVKQPKAPKQKLPWDDEPVEDAHHYQIGHMPGSTPLPLLLFRKKGLRTEIAQHRETLFPEIYNHIVSRLLKHRQGYKLFAWKLYKRFGLNESDQHAFREFMRTETRRIGSIAMHDPGHWPGMSFQLPDGGLQAKPAKEPKPAPKPQAKAKDDHKDYPMAKGEPATARPLLNKIEFMRKFLSENTKRHIKEGHDYMKASNMAKQEYSAYCKKRDGKLDSQPQQQDTVTAPEVRPAFVEFPAIKGIKLATEPYLKDIIRRLDNGKTPCLTRNMDAYVLDLSEDSWGDFLADIMAKKEQIQAALGLSRHKTFVVRGEKLYYE